MNAKAPAPDKAAEKPPFSDKQLEVLRYGNNHAPVLTILHGSIRSGKSFIDNLLWLQHVRRFVGRKFIMTGYTIPALQKNVLDDISELTGRKISLNTRNEFELLGNQICCFGADNKDSFKAMRGMTAYGWYGNEVTLQHKNTIDQAFKRCSGPGFRIFWDTNPDHPKHHIKTNYIDRSGESLPGGRGQIKAWHFQLDDNIHLDETFKEFIKSTTPSGVFYDRDILGLWASAEGMIYQDWNDSQIIEPDKLPPMVRYWAGVDWGFEHHGVVQIWGEDSDGKYYLVYEVAEKGQQLDYWLKVKTDCDKAFHPAAWYCDSARPEYVKAFNGIEADKSVIEGISYVAGLIKQKKLFVVRGQGKRFLWEIYSYCWSQTAITEAPVKTDDDAMDAARYCLYSIGTKNPTVKVIGGFW